MTMEMPYVDSVGNQYKASAWWPLGIDIVTTNRVHITWLAMKDILTLYQYLDALQRNDIQNPDDLPWIPGAIKEYKLSGPEYWGLYARNMAPGGPNLNELVHNQAEATKDTLRDGYKINPLTGIITDKDGNEVSPEVAFKSFFEGAKRS